MIKIYGYVDSPCEEHKFDISQNEMLRKLPESERL
jgi:hypothetical protein